MIIRRCMKLFASVVTYGCIALSLTTTPAIASHRHHRTRTLPADESSECQRRHSKLFARLEEKERRREHVARTIPEASDRRRHHQHHTHSEETASSAPLTHRERVRKLRELRQGEMEEARQYVISYREHLHRLYLAQQEMKEERLVAAAQYRLHLSRIAYYRKQRLAELNGEISSKSIRAWQAYVANVPIRLISVDLNDPSIKVNALIAQDGIGSAEPFARMIRRSQPDVAVTGTFFSLGDLRPVGDIVINGDLAYFGGMGTALCITPQNRAEMVTVPWGHHHNWSGYNFVMACGPRLLSNGYIVLDPAVERFRDKHMLAPNSRIGVGITPGNKLIFVMTQEPIYLGRLAKIMKAIGCKQAMNLDAGTSTGFYCDGNMMARPGRWLTNAIVVYANQHTPSRS